MADGTVDIADLFTWNDGSNVVFAMTVFPIAPSNALFSDSAQYVIHVASGAAYGATSGDYQIICTFTGTTAPQTAQCWAGTDEYVTGHADSATGIASADGKLKVFAGLRGDPFFFNLAGFHAAQKLVETNAGSLTFNDAGCPTNAPAAVAAQLGLNDDGGPAVDTFATLNALAIVVSIDHTLVATKGSVLATWASTHK
ncbi:MAG TPA: DUF4331 family protein [Polyangiaceae bacterium]